MEWIKKQLGKLEALSLDKSKLINEVLSIDIKCDDLKIDRECLKLQIIKIDEKIAKIVQKLQDNVNERLAK